MIDKRITNGSNIQDIPSTRTRGVDLNSTGDEQRLIVERLISFDDEVMADVIDTGEKSLKEYGV